MTALTQSVDEFLDTHIDEITGENMQYFVKKWHTEWHSQCRCGEWACEECFGPDEITLPLKAKTPVPNAWAKVIDVEATVSLKEIMGISEATKEAEVNDGYWTKEKMAEIAAKMPEPPLRTPVTKMVNVELICVGSKKKPGCKGQFDYTVKQQKKYRDRGWKQPKVCKQCSQKRHDNKYI